MRGRSRSCPSLCGPPCVACPAWRMALGQVVVVVKHSCLFYETIKDVMLNATGDHQPTPVEELVPAWCVRACRRERSALGRDRRRRRRRRRRRLRRSHPCPPVRACCDVSGGGGGGQGGEGGERERGAKGSRHTHDVLGACLPAPRRFRVPGGMWRLMKGHFKRHMASGANAVFIASLAGMHGLGVPLTHANRPASVEIRLQTRRTRSVPRRMFRPMAGASRHGWGVRPVAARTPPWGWACAR